MTSSPVQRDASTSHVTPVPRDINDNAPVFDQNRLVGRVPEHSRAGPHCVSLTQIRWFSSDIVRSINLLTYLLTPLTAFKVVSFFGGGNFHTWILPLPSAFISFVFYSSFETVCLSITRLWFRSELFKLVNWFISIERRDEFLSQSRFVLYISETSTNVLWIRNCNE